MKVSITVNIDDRLINFFKWFISRRKAQILIIVILLSVTIAYTQTRVIPNPNVFMSGDLIEAERINENFKLLRDTINNTLIPQIKDINGILDLDEVEGKIEKLEKGFDERNDALRSQLGDLMNATIPEGIIAMWSGDVPPPSGWLICDGTNGTPDLRDKFIVGADNSSPTADDFVFGESGIPEHTHNMKHSHHGDTANSSVHQHQWASVNTDTGYWEAYSNTSPMTILSGASLNSFDTGGEYVPLAVTDTLQLFTSDDNEVHSHEYHVTSDAEFVPENSKETVMPPYYALYFIIRKNVTVGE